ncbi:hypothetical protein CRENBAI_015535 [Crenichthys baileyi]|uniref:Uncharacterized protein n=1 Tax=Crenichthys baileyi TaxID=28760 RepID=A0AAV9SDZ5_9TELE
MPPRPSLSSSPAQVSLATPDELEERFGLFVCQLWRFRRSIHLSPSPELVEILREMEDDYEKAMRVFYSCASSFLPHLQSTAAEPPSCLQSAAAKLASCLQSAADGPALMFSANATEGQPNISVHTTEGQPDASGHTTEGLPNASAPSSEDLPNISTSAFKGQPEISASASEGPPNVSAPASEGLSDISAPVLQSYNMGVQVDPPRTHIQAFSDVGVQLDLPRPCLQIHIEGSPCAYAILPCPKVGSRLQGLVIFFPNVHVILQSLIEGS